MRRLRAESGFGLLELLIAMLVLNIGVFALVGTFNAGTIAVSRARYVSSATTVADRQMEIYRSVENCAIWLDRWLMPAANSQYALDKSAFNGKAPANPIIQYWNAGSPADQQMWVTDGMDVDNTFGQEDLASCAYLSQSALQTLPLTQAQGSPEANLDALAMATPVSSAAKPIQKIAGPDGTYYTVYTYIVLVAPGPADDPGEFTKQVTVVVYDPHNLTRVLAREVSTFDPIAGAPRPLP